MRKNIVGIEIQVGKKKSKQNKKSGKPLYIFFEEFFCSLKQFKKS
jgi:hypothetical protein